MPDKKKTLLIDTDGIVKALSDNQFLNIPDNGRNFDKPIPYMPAERLQDGSLAGIYMMNDGIRDGWKTLYDRNSYSNDIYRDESGNYYRIKNGLEEGINMNGLTRLSYDELRKVLPKRDYIGGNKEEAAIKALRRIPGFTDYIRSRANAYGIDPNVIINRIAKEGYARDIAVEYNELDSAGQNDEFWERLWDRKVDGFSQFGLDDAASHMNAGYYTLLDPEASWSEGYNVNEKGREVLSANPDNLKSAVEILTAEMKYRQDKMKDRYSLSDNELGIYANAAYNLGLYSKDLDDKNYVIRKYSYPDYYRTYGLSYKNGGNIKTRKEKLSELAEKIKSSGYKFSNGGSIIDRYGADSVKQALGRMREVSTVKKNTYKDGGGKLVNLLRRMSNAAIMNDPNTGVVAQASGYSIDPSGNILQNPEDDGAQQLSKNIAVLSSVPNAIMSSQVVAPAMAVLVNPLAANTTAGALMATAADAYGVVEGARQLGLDAEKAISGEYRVADIPKTLMDATVLLPGSSTFSSGFPSMEKIVMKYPSGVADRLAEAVLRTGDYARSPYKLKEQLLNKKALTYILNPNAPKSLAYDLPYKYSGEIANFHKGAHEGDIVDQFLGKAPVPGARYGEIPSIFRKYVKEKYPGKNIPTVNIGEARSNFSLDKVYGPVHDAIESYAYALPRRFGARSGHVADMSGKSVVDPGGFNLYAEMIGDKGVKFDGYDIWKFNPEEYVKNNLAYEFSRRGLKNRFTNLLRKKGLKFIDGRGTPIIHHWTETYPTYFTDSPL